MASVKKNFGYNLILTFCNYLFPLLTYPYVSRVLGVDRIGTCNFVDGIINYFVLFSALGVGSYGVREIAKCKDDADRRSCVFTNLVVLNAIGTFVSVLILIILTFELDSLQEYRNFLWIGVAKLVFSLFLIEWFFQGIQNFRFITIRSVIVRLLYIVCVFVFIHTKEDTLIYYGLTSFTIVVNSIINWNFSRRYRHFSFKYINLKSFIIPILAFGYYRLLTSMYTTFNLVFLGFATNDTEVGYFSTATKLYSILMGVFTAFTTVMVPKVSELLASGDYANLQRIANKTFSALTIVALPIIVFCLFCTEDIILTLSGSGYEGAYTPFKIVIFLLLIIGMEQIVIQQFLMASQSNKSIFMVSTIGAVVGVLLNICITPRLGAIGSAISWGISEFTVLCVGMHLTKKYVGIKLQISTLFANVLWTSLYIIPLAAIYTLHLSQWLNLIACAVSTGVVFFILNLRVRKNELVADTVGKILNKVGR